MHAAFIECQAKRQEIEQRGLAGTRLAHHCQHFAGMQIEGHVAAGPAGAESLADTAHRKQHVVIHADASTGGVTASSG